MHQHRYRHVKIEFEYVPFFGVSKTMLYDRVCHHKNTFPYHIIYWDVLQWLKKKKKNFVCLNMLCRDGNNLFFFVDGNECLSKYVLSSLMEVPFLTSHCYHFNESIRQTLLWHSIMFYYMRLRYALFITIFVVVFLLFEEMIVNIKDFHETFFFQFLELNYFNLMKNYRYFKITILYYSM